MKKTNNVVGEMKIKKEITKDEIESVIIGCFEGGSNYWMGLNNTGEDWERRPKGEPLSTWAVELLIEGKTVHLFDVEDEDEKWELTLDKLIKGITLNYLHRPHDCNIEEGDVITTDCILQYALFGEIVYG